MLDLFRELQVLGQTLNFTKAANLLHMSQSSLTRHIATMRTFIVSPTYLGMMKSSSETRCPIPKLSEDCMGVL